MSTHQVTITVADPECPEDIDFTIEHLADGPSCVVWRGCEKCSKWDEAKLRARYDGAGCYDEVVYHGVEHRMIEGEWMTRTTECGLQAYWSDHDWVRDIYRDLGPGPHPVDVEYEGEGCWIGVAPVETPGDARDV